MEEEREEKSVEDAKRRAMEGRREERRSRGGGIIGPMAILGPTIGPKIDAFCFFALVLVRCKGVLVERVGWLW
jgi:hypothetical protein